MVVKVFGFLRQGFVLVLVVTEVGLRWWSGRGQVGFDVDVERYSGRQEVQGRLSA